MKTVRSIKTIERWTYAQQTRATWEAFAGAYAWED